MAEKTEAFNPQSREWDMLGAGPLQSHEKPQARTTQWIFSLFPDPRNHKVLYVWASLVAQR